MAIFVGKIATSLSLVSKVKWGVMMTMLEYKIRRNKMSLNFSANWIIPILTLTTLEQNFRSRFKVALEFFLRFGKIGLYKLRHTPPGFITGHYCNADKKALSFQRLSSYKFILLRKGM